LEEAIKLLSDNVWADSSVRFYAERDAKIHAGKRAPKGMQGTLNEVISDKFSSHGWEGDSGYYVKGRTWVRVTFRHQMSLGSDIIDAIKVCKKERMELAVILAANRNTLSIISPNDAGALTSFEKLQSEIWSLNGVIEIPLLIGELSPMTMPSQIISDELRKDRPRDKTIPTDSK
jgi:hypothetical protein